MTNPTNATGDGAYELVRQRDQLRAWIAKLDEVQTGTPSRVAQRVRADYEDRLRRVTEDLAAHGEEIERALEQVRADLAAAEERRAHAGDAFDEQELRFTIGELDDAAWGQARPGLENEVAEADEAVARAREEVERLATLSTEISGGGAEEAAAEPESAPEEPAGETEEA